MLYLEKQRTEEKIMRYDDQLSLVAIDQESRNPEIGKTQAAELFAAVVDILIEEGVELTESVKGSICCI